MAAARDGRKRREDGGLEAEVLAAVWSFDHPALPAEVQERLGGLAYSTVVTTLTRLMEKGLLDRSRVGRAYAYRPVMTEAELTAHRMHAVLERAEDRRAVLATFLGGLHGDDERDLRALVASMGWNEK